MHFARMAILLLVPWIQSSAVVAWSLCCYTCRYGIADRNVFLTAPLMSKRETENVYDHKPVHTFSLIASVSTALV